MSGEPKVETLSKEEIEKREGDRETDPKVTKRDGKVLFDHHGWRSAYKVGTSITRKARKHQWVEVRSKKKRRFRSLSPLARGGTWWKRYAGCRCRWLWWRWRTERMV
jgi:chromatin structure-remodeling complex subunit SFH1